MLTLTYMIPSLSIVKLCVKMLPVSCFFYTILFVLFLLLGFSPKEKKGLFVLFLLANKVGKRKRELLRRQSALRHHDELSKVVAHFFEVLDVCRLRCIAFNDPVKHYSVGTECHLNDCVF